MNTYIYILKLIDRLNEDTAWTEEDESLVTAHFNRLKDNYDKGIVIHAGRTEETGNGGFGIVIFKGGNDEMAMEFMKGDPAVSGGIMTAEVRRYRAVLI
mgnify:CR=1 FL=1